MSGSKNLVSVLNLGNQELTGVFPKDASDPVPAGPLELLWCPDSGLLQLAHRSEPTDRYGENHGYRSGLNQSMVRHLSQKILPDFFSAEAYHRVGSRPAKVVASIAMLHDLDDPIAFTRDVESILTPDGLWHFKHLEYYSMAVVQKILQAAGLKLVDADERSPRRELRRYSREGQLRRMVT